MASSMVKDVSSRCGVTQTGLVTLIHDDRQQIVFSLGTGAISWSSKRQPTVALSSTEAEYRAACYAACEAIWLRRLLSELGFPQTGSTLVRCDNQSCIALAKNPVFHARTKHIEIQYHYVRERVLAGDLRLEYCPTAEYAADIFTKASISEDLGTTSSASWSSINIRC
eukprot:c6286_g1_i1 orf=12-515(-)